MALTTTYLTGNVAAGDQKISVNAFTAVALSGISPRTLLRFATGEYALLTDNVSTQLSLVRGYLGTPAQAHYANEAVQYGLINDAAWPAAGAPVVALPPVILKNAQEITATGTTGTTAGLVTAPWPGFLNVTGAANSGVNLPYPQVGAAYWVKNFCTGVIKVYSVGASINGITGVTGYVVSGSTGTGTLGAQFVCATAGAWQVVPLTALAG